MDSENIHARIEHETAELRSCHPRITTCHSALAQWSEGAQRRYSVNLDIRWPQHQSLIAGEARDSAEAAIAAAFQAARERLQPLDPARRPRLPMHWSRPRAGKYSNLR
jgi:hypothetical protein